MRLTFDNILIFKYLKIHQTTKIFAPALKAVLWRLSEDF